MSATITMLAMQSVSRIPTETGMAQLREMFPDGEADDLNFVMFSTSGVHGSYATIEDIAEEFERDGTKAAHLTVLIVHPRTVYLQFGHIRVERDDLPFLRTLRATSARVMARANTPMSKIDAKGPCPWHGDNADLAIEDNGVGCFWVACNKNGCGCEGPYAHSETEAWEKWNRRALSAPPLRMGSEDE